MTPEAREQQLQAILHAYLLAVDRGEAPDRPALLAAHPDLREELAEYFADASKLEALAKSLKTATFAGGSGAAAPRLGTVRYFGDYELLEEIARGGMGVVYRAKQVSLNRVVALKMILQGEFASEADVRRFRQEAEAAANLDHPHIVPIFEVGEHEGQQYFSMKLIETKARLGSESGESSRAVAARLAKVARAVHHAHQRGVLHRDLKPSNILIDKHGEPHVADFGLAKKVEGGQDATKTGAIVGTPAYMAPEQARAEKSLTTAVDVWSLGAILYEWLTGRPPFRGDDAIATLMKVVADEPVRPRGVDPTIDRDLETICLKCLEKEPARRYASAAALADDLDRWQRGEPIAIRSTGRVERAVRWARRRPTAAALLATTALIAIGLPSAVLWHFTTLQAQRAAAAEERAAIESDGRRKAESFQRETARALHDTARSLAASRVNQAFRAWQDSELGHARTLLDECPDVFHFWDWHFVDRLLRSSDSLAPVHTAAVNSVACGPDGLRWASASQNEVKVWDGRTGDLLFNLPGGECVAFSPDGLSLAVGGRKTHVVIWDVVSGKERLVLNNATGPVAFSPDGRLLASGGGKASIQNKGEPVPDGAKLWDTATGEARLRLRVTDDFGDSICFSSDGKSVAVGAGDVALVFDAISGERTFAETVSYADQPSIPGVALSPDGRRLAAVVFHSPYSRHSVKVFDLRARRQVFELPGPEYWPTNVAFSPDGTRFAFGGSLGTVVIHEALAGKSLVTLRGGSARSLAFTDDGRRLLVGGWDHGFRAYDARVGGEALTLAQLPGLNAYRDAFTGAPERDPRAAALSSDGRRLALLQNATNLQVLDVRSGARLFATRIALGDDAALSFASDERTLLVAEQTRARVYDAQGRECFARQGLTAIPIVDPRRERVLLASADGVEIRELPSGKFVAKLEDVVVESLEYPPTRFSACGRWVAMMHSDDSGYVVDVWRVATGNRVFRRSIETWRLFGAPLEFSPNGEWIAFAIDLGVGAETRRAVVAWDFLAGKEVLSHIEPDGTIGDIGFSPRGDLLAWSVNVLRAGPNNFAGFVRVSETDTGRVRHQLRGYNDSIQDLAFSPDGERLLTLAGSDLRVWDVRSGQNALTTSGALCRTRDSADASSSAIIWGGLPAILDVGRLPPNHERAFRLAHFQPEPGWHDGSARRAEEREDWTAAAFHLGRMLRDAPDNDGLRDRLSQAREKLATGPKD